MTNSIKTKQTKNLTKKHKQKTSARISQNIIMEWEWWRLTLISTLIASITIECYEPFYICVYDTQNTNSWFVFISFHFISQNDFHKIRISCLKSSSTESLMCIWSDSFAENWKTLNSHYKTVFSINIYNFHKLFANNSNNKKFVVFVLVLPWWIYLYSSAGKYVHNAHIHKYKHSGSLTIEQANEKWIIYEIVYGTEIVQLIF